MKRKPKGIIHNAFYKKNNFGDTKDTFWSRTQGANVEILKCKQQEQERIVFSGKSNSL